MHPIEKELKKLTRVKPQPGEDRQRYLQRIMEYAQDSSKVTDEMWESLTAESQTWCNQAVAAFKVGSDIPDFSSEDEEDFNETENELSESNDEELKEEQKFKTKEKVTHKKKKKVKKPLKTGKKGRTGTRDVGIKIRIKKLIIKKPGISVDELMTALQKDGPVPSKFTVSGIRAEFRHSLKLLKSEGLIDLEL